MAASPTLAARRRIAALSRTTALAGLLGLLVLGACAQPDRAAESSTDGATAASAPAPPAPTDAGSPAVPSGEPDPRVKGLRGVDVCIFNKRAEPFTVTFDGNPGIQGSPEVQPGDWVCGYDSADAPVAGDIRGIPDYRLHFDAENMFLFSPTLGLQVWQGARMTCGRGEFLGEGGTVEIVWNGVRYAGQRNDDDDYWKYFVVNVEPAQDGAGNTCAGS